MQDTKISQDPKISKEPAEIEEHPVTVAEVAPGLKEATVGTDTKKEAKTKDNPKPFSPDTKDKVKRYVGTVKTAPEISVHINICLMRNQNQGDQCGAIEDSKET